jgi:hypothetical protein
LSNASSIWHSVIPAGGATSLAIVIVPLVANNSITPPGLRWHWNIVPFGFRMTNPNASAHLLQVGDLHSGDNVLEFPNSDLLHVYTPERFTDSGTGEM